MHHSSRPESVRLCVVSFESDWKEEEEEGEFGHCLEVVAVARLAGRREKND